MANGTQQVFIDLVWLYSPCTVGRARNKSALLYILVVWSETHEWPTTVVRQLYESTTTVTRASHDIKTWKIAPNNSRLSYDCRTTDLRQTHDCTITHFLFFRVPLVEPSWTCHNSCDHSKYFKNILHNSATTTIL